MRQTPWIAVVHTYFLSDLRSSSIVCYALDGGIRDATVKNASEQS